MNITPSQQQEIIQHYITILAFYDGYSLSKELSLPPEDPRMIRWQQTAQSLFDAMMEAIA